MKRVLLAVALVLMAVAGLWLWPPARSRSPTEFQLIARHMAFRTPDIVGLDNPTLHCRPDELIAITFTNRDPGHKHSLAIPDLNLRTPVLRYGQSVKLMLVVPAGRTSLDYVCAEHSNMMRGKISIH